MLVYCLQPFIYTVVLCFQELEKLKEELEKEKLKMANYAKDIQEEYDTLKK